MCYHCGFVFMFDPHKCLRSFLQILLWLILFSLSLFYANRSFELFRDFDPWTVYLVTVTYLIWSFCKLTLLLGNASNGFLFRCSSIAECLQCDVCLPFRLMTQCGLCHTHNNLVFFSLVENDYSIRFVGILLPLW